MSKCIDCFHYEICEAYSPRDSYATLHCAEECVCFTDRSEWVHLPYKVREQEIKSKAYKEFAERLKEKLGDCHIVSDEEYCGFDCGDIHKCIDNLLKEMVGEDNA